MEHKDFIRFLGANGARTKSKGATCIQITDRMVIDGGNLIYGLGEKMLEVDTIFLTHAHLDHVCDIPFLADEVISNNKNQITIYAHPAVIRILQEHLFNNLIWPDFSRIRLPHSEKSVIRYEAIEPGRSYEMEGYTLTPVKTEHTEGSCGYVIKKGGAGIFVTADTYCCDAIWEELNADEEIHTLCIDVSFPSRFEKLAYESKHLTPRLLSSELEKLRRDDVRVCLMHLKPSVGSEVALEAREYGILREDGIILQDNDIIYFEKNERINNVKEY